MLKKVLLVMGLSLLMAGCRATRIETTPTPSITHLNLAVSSTVMPLAQSLTQAYIRQDTLFLISLHETNWRGVENQIAADESLYGMTTFLPDQSNLWAAPVGEDGIAIITRRDNNLPVLLASQLRAIFSGGVGDWSEVGGAAAVLTVVSYDAGSDTRLAFERMVMGERQITPAARLAPTAPSMIDIVAATPGAIGYVSFALVDHRVQVVPVAGTPGEAPISPSLASIAAQTYPLRTPILLVGQQAPAPGTPIFEFFLWMQQGEGQQVIGRRVVPLAKD